MDSNKNSFKIDINSFSDAGDGIITFPKGLTITDNSLQRNGTQYDIQSLDTEEYKGTITADHIDKIENVIGKVDNIHKTKNSVLVDSIKFAVKENPLGKLAYNLFKGGFITDFSIETYGPKPDDNGVYYNSSLIGLSAVVTGNNKNATINELVCNSIRESQKEGFDTTELETALNITVTDEAEAENEDAEEEKVEVVEEVEEVEVVEDNNIKEGETDMSKTDVKEEVKVENKVEEKESAENSFVASLEKVMAPLQAKIEALEAREKEAFDKSAKEPSFTIAKDENKIESMSWKDLHAKQVNAAWEWKKQGRAESATVLNEINAMNLENLKKSGVVQNSLTISDFGNFVISPELLTQIEGCRNDYSGIVSATDWKETLSTQFAWLKRSGDIDMQSVEFCDDGADGNLKPVSEYTASIQTSNLEELAAVTPVCNAATRFLAADLVGDVAQGYRNDYDRKRAQLVIARLEQAVESNGNSVIYDVNPATGGLTSWVDTWAEIATCTPNGTFIFNASTYAEIMKQAVLNGVNGPLGNIFITGAVPTIFGRPFIVTPDDLLPTLNSAQTKAFAIDGATVTVNHGAFYANLSNFTGRTSGGLQYDLSTDAAYEDGGDVKSAFQRNELVLRGSFFRGGAIKDTDQVSGLLSPGVS